MAYANNVHFSNNGIFSAVNTLRENIVGRISRYMHYRATLTELSNLDERQLEDMGITRSMITSISAEAAYGKN